MGEQEAIRVARRAVEAFNAADWQAVSADLASDSTYEEPATGRSLRGVEEILEAERAWKAAFPDASGTITNALASGSTAVLEITWRGTQSGDLVTPAGVVPATGRRVAIKAVQVVEVENGKSKSNRHYFDLAGMLAQLGVGVSATA
ncbi:MAG TPA: ester cyclase [Candidatus Dormibacteraeota bacterium]|nr:ester cyclase [Candidatus Dormibacteraeota bacterium]